MKIKIPDSANPHRREVWDGDTLVREYETCRCKSLAAFYACKWGSRENDMVQYCHKPSVGKERTNAGNPLPFYVAS